MLRGGWRTTWLAAFLALGAGCTTSTPRSDTASSSRPAVGGGVTQHRSGTKHTLRAEQTWRLNLPNGDRFDASGLIELPGGDLVTVNDRGPTLYRVEFHPGLETADLTAIPGWFTAEQLAQLAGSKSGRYDIEGIARDKQGRIYLCEEANRWVLRLDLAEQTVERLNIDWRPVRKYFSAGDPNASFEGIAVGQGRLYLANERKVGRIVVVDLATLEVVDSFSAKPFGVNARDIHYTDLSWFDGHLYVLLRESRLVLKIDAATHRVMAQYDFSEIERAPENAYVPKYPTGIMEGLAVDQDYIWLATDNNGQPRVRHREDYRPTLYKCRRPDR